MRLLEVYVTLIFSISTHTDASVINVASICAINGMNTVTCASSAAEYLFNGFTTIAGWKGGTRSIDAFGGQCIGKYDGGWHKWQWKYGAEVICPHVSPSVKGYAIKSKSRNGAIKHAMHDYIEKVTKDGLLTVEQIASYNLGYLLPKTTTEFITTTTQFPKPSSAHVLQTNKAQQLASKYIVIIGLALFVSLL
jgi:hypothetical protein